MRRIARWCQIHCLSRELFTQGTSITRLRTAIRLARGPRATFCDWLDTGFYSEAAERHDRRILTIHPPVRRPVRAGHMDSCQAPTNGVTAPGPGRYAARKDGSPSRRAPSEPIASFGMGLCIWVAMKRFIEYEVNTIDKYQRAPNFKAYARLWILNPVQEPVPPSQ
ncbi:hypothetical protein V8C34DRAFT_318394 [Trichoderma compactum]